MKKNTQGFIALASVLILSAIFLSLSIGIATRAIREAKTDTALRERDSALYLSEACAEYARMELERTLDYQGNEGILMDEGSCQILPIEGVGNTNRILRVQSTVGTHTYRIEYGILTVSPHMVITSSERVTSF
ncbi:MAG: hypothetical protein WAW13_01475 [Minisyncoccia bacterium]